MNICSIHTILCTDLETALPDRKPPAHNAKSQEATSSKINGPRYSRDGAYGSPTQTIEGIKLQTRSPIQPPSRLCAPAYRHHVQTDKLQDPHSALWPWIAPLAKRSKRTSDFCWKPLIVGQGLNQAKLIPIQSQSYGIWNTVDAIKPDIILLTGTLSPGE